MYPLVIFLSLIGLVVNLGAIWNTTVLMQRLRRSGFNGEIALPLHNRRNRALTRALISLACLGVGLWPSLAGLRVVIFISIALTDWVSIAEAFSNRRAEEIAADRIARELKDRINDPS